MTPLRLLLSICSLSALLGGPAASGGDWPQWLGPERNSHASGASQISKLPSDVAPVWRKSCGGGFSSPVVAGGKLVYFDENGTNEVVHCLNAADGKELWQREIAARYVDEWAAGPRSTPTINDQRVYALACNGEFRCLDLADGRVSWSSSFEKDFGVKFVGSKAKEGTAARRGNNGSPLIDGPDLILPVGSPDGATLVCFDKKTGRIKWKAGNEEAAYSSPQVADIAGTRQVVYLSADSLSGFERNGGKVLWTVPLQTAAKRHAATPVIYDDTILVNSHTFGLRAFRITKTGDAFEAKEVWVNRELKINLSTPALLGHHLFSQGPSKNFICADAATGELKWSQPGFGKENSSTIVNGTNLLNLTDGGELVLLQGDSSHYAELGRVQVCGKNWNFPALADGKLYVRDAREIACFDLAK
jgi:outer membrane protein assembly factor BamB